VNQLCGAPLSREELVEAVLDGEAVASQARHGDNALPALFGGAILVSAEDPRQYRRLEAPDPPPIAILLPRLEILTANARALLPESVSLASAVSNASSLAHLVAAMMAGDWEEAGRMMMRDRIVEPVRARLRPGFEAVRHAALEAGAFGCAISGSGPAVFALAPDDTTAREVLEAMSAAVPADGYAPGGVVARMDRAGARTVPVVSGPTVTERLR
jgi:homoserine kinase